VIYLIGSLRNKEVPKLAERLRDRGYEVFDDWYAAGPEADDYWQQYEKGRGHNYREALAGYAANHVFEYDHFHLNRADAGILMMPAGKSGHLEFGYLIGQGKPGFILVPEEPERFDVMYRFATEVCLSEDELVAALDEHLERDK
jgi:nucleoside 2-deoxyribosyltransferase